MKISIGNDKGIFVDQCILDQYIVSNHNRNVILGRPTLYLAVDKETRKVRAFHVSINDDIKEAINVMLENMILISNNDEPFPDRIEIRGGVKIPDMRDVVQKFDISLSIVPPSKAINLERKIKDINRIFDASKVGTIPARNSRRSAFPTNVEVPQGEGPDPIHASLTIEELRAIIHNWIQNLTLGENNVI